jgi:hypothetical protein
MWSVSIVVPWAHALLGVIWTAFRGGVRQS